MKQVTGKKREEVLIIIVIVTIIAFCIIAYMLFSLNFLKNQNSLWMYPLIALMVTFIVGSIAIFYVARDSNK